MPKKEKSKLRIIPLGGLNEIGKNITVLEYANDIIVVDCGLAFPDDDMLGIDLVIPDITYLEENADRIRGILLTHGHEDHIGAIPYILRSIITEKPDHFRDVRIDGTAFLPAAGLLALETTVGFFFDMYRHDWTSL